MPLIVRKHIARIAWIYNNVQFRTLSSSSTRHQYEISSPSPELINRLLFSENPGTHVNKLKLVFIPDTCYKVKRFWHVPIVAWAYDDHYDYQQKSNKDITNLLPPEDREILLAQCENSPEKRERLESSLHPFLVTSLRNQKLHLQIDKHAGFLKWKSSRKGCFWEYLQFTKEEIVNAIEDDDVLSFRGSIDNDANNLSFTGYSLFPERKGLSVVAGVEGTLRECNPLHRSNLLGSTFLTDYQAVPGMIELVKKIRSHYQASFHWISSASLQLYEELARFFSRHDAPRGSFHMHSFNSPRLHESHLKFRLFDTYDRNFGNKVDKIENIILKYPKREFILIGNSSEHDPEMFGELYRRFPDQILKIFIRDSAAQTDSALIDAANASEAARGSTVRFNDENRFPEAFYKVPREKWVIFNEPSEIITEHLLENCS